MKPYILIVDDETRYNVYYRSVARQVALMTRGAVDVEYLAPVKLAAAKPQIMAAISARTKIGGVLVGLVVDVFDAEANEPLAGLTLVQNLRLEREFTPLMGPKIVLVTVKGHIDEIPAHEGDELLPRLYNVPVDEAALRLLYLFGLHGFVKEPPSRAGAPLDYHERPKVAVIYVDDDPKRDTFLRCLAERIQEMTMQNVVMHPVVPVTLENAAPHVMKAIEAAIDNGYLPGGIVIDVYDEMARDPVGGKKLLQTLRKMPGFVPKLMKIVLVTIKGHLSPADVPEADGLILRSLARGLDEAAHLLLEDLGLADYIPVTMPPPRHA